MTASTFAPPDPVDAVPPPAVVRHMLADLTRRRELLKSLLRVSVRKAAYPAPVPPNPVDATAGDAAAGKVVQRA